MSRTLTFLVAALMLLSTPLCAQCGGGNAGIQSTPLVLGSTVTVSLNGGANQSFQLYLSATLTFLPIPGVGNLCINPGDPFFGLLMAGNLDVNGQWSVSTPIPNNPALLGVPVFLQALITDPTSPSGFALSPGLRVQFSNPDTFTPQPSLSAPRALASGNVVPDGRVIVAGGGAGTLLNPTGTNTTELYDPLTRSWGPGPGMSTNRAMQSSVTLPDGRVLYAGGVGVLGIVTNTVEIFDPKTNSFSPAASMFVPRAAAAGIRLANGNVLVAGGTNTFVPGAGGSILPILNGAQNSGEVYNPATNTWTPVANFMSSKRMIFDGGLLQDGRALLISGLNGGTTFFGQEIPTWTSSCNYYDPGTNTFSAAPAIPTARTAAVTTVMPNGDVFTAGGVIAGFLSIPTVTDTTRIFSAGAWSSGPTLPAVAALQGQVLLKNGKVHVSGGIAGTLLALSATNLCGVFDGSSLSQTASMPLALGSAATVRLNDGSVLIAGGGDASGAALANVTLYAPAP